MTDSQTILIFVFFGMAVWGLYLLGLAGFAIAERIRYAFQNRRISEVRKAGL